VGIPEYNCRTRFKTIHIVLLCVYFISILIFTPGKLQKKRGPEPRIHYPRWSRFCELLRICISDCCTDVSKRLPSLSGQRRSLITPRVDEGAGSSGRTISWFPRDVWSSICSGRCTRPVSAAPCQALSWPTPACLRGSG